jgi:hypothetical protein
MADIETKIKNFQIATDFLKNDGLESINIQIKNLFEELTKNLNDRLINLVKTPNGQTQMQSIIKILIAEINKIKEADIELTKVFKDYINKPDLNIGDELGNIYNELFFMQVKLINDTIYKVMHDKQKIIDLKPLLSTLHKKIQLLNSYIQDNSLEKKI